LLSGVSLRADYFQIEIVGFWRPCLLPHGRPGTGLR
jgi:hypothetical protein